MGTFGNSTLGGGLRIHLGIVVRTESFSQMGV